MKILRPSNLTISSALPVSFLCPISLMFATSRSSAAYKFTLRTSHILRGLNFSKTRGFSLWEEVPHASICSVYCSIPKIKTNATKVSKRLPSKLQASANILRIPRTSSPSFNPARSSQSMIPSENSPKKEPNLETLMKSMSTIQLSTELDTRSIFPILTKKLIKSQTITLTSIEDTTLAPCTRDSCPSESLMCSLWAFSLVLQVTTILPNIRLLL